MTTLTTEQIQDLEDLMREFRNTLDTDPDESYGSDQDQWDYLASSFLDWLRARAPSNPQRDVVLVAANDGEIVVMPESIATTAVHITL